jgi:hypothetical protein
MGWEAQCVGKIFQGATEVKVALIVTSLISDPYLFQKRRPGTDGERKRTTSPALGAGARKQRLLLGQKTVDLHLGENFAGIFPVGR